MKSKRLLKVLTLSTLSLAMLIPQLTFASGINNINITSKTQTEEFTIYIHKLMYKNKINDFIKNTGDELKIDNPDVKPYNRQKYGDVGFSLYKVDNSVLKVEKDMFKIADEVGKAVLDNKKTSFKFSKINDEIKVNDEGISKIEIKNPKHDDLYVLVETTSPTSTIKRSKPICFSIPYNGHTKQLHLYPKNQINPANNLSLDFFKFAQDNKENEEKPLDGARFKLYYGKASDIENAKVVKSFDKDMILETKNGKITLNNLVKGNYFLVEQAVDSLVDDLKKDNDNSKYLVSGISKLDSNNKLSFSVDENGNINSSKEFKHFVNYERAYSNKRIVNETKSKDLSKVKKNNYAIFEDIDFRIDVDVPKDIKDYSKLVVKDKLVLGDNITDHLEYIENSFTIKSKTSLLEKDKDYKIAFNKDKNAFEISFIDNENLQDNIAIKYKAQFKNKNNIVANGDYKNKVEFVFNNSKYNNNKDRVENKETKFTTYGFKVKKVNDTIFETNKKGLKGAEFILENEKGEKFVGFKENEKGKAISFEKVDDNKAYKFISSDDGSFNVVGLSSGIYYLREIKAPSGYRLSKDTKTKIVIKDDSVKDGTIKDIVNSKDGELVVTGKEDLIKTVAIAGGSLMLISVFYIKLKKDEKEKAK
ncbi:SpaA isopeptide-forming pilin-related protein [Finegoldia magna]|uniref:Putative collagen adhesion protein n=1 Tax=Finegoldia magna (strain ATCC 29328 / DSM 20472 / WAL 2508) TaxID=334413 RepID=B0S4I1_FINM2|nr:SpaA isopeptide-forming pilin-related protein [Finegoldia magna]UEA71146.1 hypothetical protein LK415_09465 [Finegoldia magna]BAG09172.1 putative collagen adhesion protein [Finegoldia magna ATCC 29328]